ncbi:hypothetical protein C6P40_005093 [Pichia californica]|uniref:Mitochondrial peculiar membrane protein 1 n=1 Tax=Pichia californica TaxID=460514 RepID=A0A9P7BEJ8_9ASCO|nr:hypothetical protein C6P42_000638 [[Candida] californica]KAG0689402.1 hypothetical protein C6P40_005093 [[Candida] californica]
MGLFDSNKDKVEAQGDVKINSATTGSPMDSIDSVFNDNIQKTLSLTNDLTLNALGKLRGFGDGWNSLLDSLDQVNDGRIPLLGPGILSPRVIHEPNQIISKGIPPSEIYEECTKAEGLSVWDEQGLWHCLFPRAKIPYDYGTGETKAFGIGPEEAKQLISREDVENDVDHKKGLFFKNLEDMLGWQAGMKRALAESRRQQWSSWEAKEKAKWNSWKLGGSSSEDNNNNDDDEKTVVGRETETRMITLDNGDLQRTTTQRRVYADGTSRIWEKTEVVGPDGTIKKSN